MLTRLRKSAGSFTNIRKVIFSFFWPNQKRCALEDESQLWPTSRTPASHCSCTHLGARTDWGDHPTLVTAGTHWEGRWVRQAGLGSNRPVIAGGWSAGTVQDVIHTVAASQWEGPGQNKSVRWQSKSKDQDASTTWDVSEIHVSWTGPVARTFEMTLHILWELPREACEIPGHNEALGRFSSMGPLQLSMGHTLNNYPTGIRGVPGAPAWPIAILLPGVWLLHLPCILQRLDISFREPATPRAQEQRQMRSRQPWLVVLQSQLPNTSDLHPSFTSIKPHLPLPYVTRFLHFFHP